MLDQMICLQMKQLADMRDAEVSTYITASVPERTPLVFAMIQLNMSLINMASYL